MSSLSRGSKINFVLKLVYSVAVTGFHSFTSSQVPAATQLHALPIATAPLENLYNPVDVLHF